MKPCWVNQTCKLDCRFLSWKNLRISLDCLSNSSQWCQHGSVLEKKLFLICWCGHSKFFFGVIGRYSSKFAEGGPLLHSCNWLTKNICKTTGKHFKVCLAYLIAYALFLGLIFCRSLWIKDPIIANVYLLPFYNEILMVSHIVWKNIFTF